MRSIEYRWSTQDNNTVDRVPYVGKLSAGSKNLYVATMLLTDMILGRENPWAEVFDPSRFKPVTSARDFITENANVVKRFMADRIETPELDDLGKLPGGRGEVVEWEGERVAVYKDEQGRVYSCSANCTHMGCVVHWNPAEESWDCPCHGSRFNYDGRVIQGPANKDLEAVDLSDGGDGAHDAA